MSQQAYTGDESTDKDYHSALGNVIYNPYTNENPFLYEGFTPVASVAAVEPSITLESPAARRLPVQIENTANTLRQDPEGRRLRVAPAPVQFLGSSPAPTTLQSHTSGPYRGFFAGPANTAPITPSPTSSLVTTPALPSLSSAPVLTGVSTGHHQEAKTIKKTSKGEKGEKKEKSKNGQAKNPFQAKWYLTKKVYSDLTYYHKITIPGLAAFLKGEGIDVDSAFPTGAKYYLIQANGSLKGLNRGWAIVQKAKMVHQRVINFKKKKASTLPDCRDGDNNDSLLVVTGSAASGKNGSNNKAAEKEAFEGDSPDGDFEWENEPVTLNSVTPKTSFGRTTSMSKSQTIGRKSKRPLENDADSDGEDVTYVQSNHQQGSRPAKTQKTGLVTNGHSIQPDHPDFAPWNTATTLRPALPDQQTRDEVSAAHIQIPGEAQENWSGMDTIVILNMFNGLKRLQENFMAEIDHMTLQGVQDGIRTFTTTTGQQSAAPEYTVNSEGTVVDNAGEVVISIEVQKIVQMIVSAEAHYRNSEALQPLEDELLSREELGRLNIEDYDFARSALIQRLETDVNWTISHDFHRPEIIDVVEKIWPRLDPIIDNN